MALSHDFHQLYKHGPPAANGYCAKRVAHGVLVCSKGTPKHKDSRVRGVELYMDPNSVDLWGIELGVIANTNTHNPVIQLFNLYNTDSQPVLSKRELFNMI